jgi:hypothetical protein
MLRTKDEAEATALINARKRKYLNILQRIANQSQYSP